MLEFENKRLPTTILDVVTWDILASAFHYSHCGQPFIPLSGHHHILTYLHPSLEDQILKSRAKPLFSQLPKNEMEPPPQLNFT